MFYAIFTMITVHEVSAMRNQSAVTAAIIKPLTQLFKRQFNNALHYALIILKSKEIRFKILDLRF